MITLTYNGDPQDGKMVMAFLSQHRVKIRRATIDMMEKAGSPKDLLPFVVKSEITGENLDFDLPASNWKQWIEDSIPGLISDEEYEYASKAQSLLTKL
jgi:hypothetical protein